MDNTWIDQLQAYLQDVNRTCVDGQSGRLRRYFSEQQEAEGVQERGQEQSAHNDQSDRTNPPKHVIRPRASRLHAAPLVMAQIGERQAVAVLDLYQRLFDTAGALPSSERRWLERVKLERAEDGRWLLVEPWEWDARRLFLTAPGSLRRGQPVARTAVWPGGYDRQRAAAYAEMYWNSYNPAYRRFDVDCTNYVSQCLHAGGIPMVYTQNRSTGWWYRGGAKANWSYSWAVAHSLYLMLRAGKAPFYARQVEHPSQLEIGDVICYDFDGDGRWQHNTIVVAKDEQNMPLVNAHTVDSRHRYWEYRDSASYTPKIRYGFFRIRPVDITSG